MFCRNFPFNNIKDCFEFNNVLHNFFNDFPLFGHFVPNTQQSSIPCNQSLWNNDDADPDSNFFYQLHTSCTYYLPSDVQNAIVKLELKNQLLILHVNARNLEKKQNTLSILIKLLNVNVDIIAVSETWKTVSNSNYIFLPGYIKVSNSRQEGRKGDGVALVIMPNFYFTICDNYKTSSFKSVLVS